MNWNSARKLIESAERLDRDARLHLEEVLKRSSDLLAPLSDPMTLNLGAHRWMAAHREESYSDWLAWILDGTSGPVILSLFGITDVEPMNCPAPADGGIYFCASLARTGSTIDSTALVCIYRGNAQLAGELWARLTTVPAPGEYRSGNNIFFEQSIPVDRFHELERYLDQAINDFIAFISASDGLKRYLPDT